MDVFAELKRFIEPFDASTIEAALRGRASIFDVDGTFQPHHHGRPRAPGPLCFDGDALLAGMQAVCFLGTMLPPDDPMRAGVRGLYAKIKQRLLNPGLLLYASYTETEPGDGVVVGSNYTYFCPVKLNERGIAKLRDTAKLSYPNVTYPWATLYPAWSVVGTPGVEALVACEAFELVPPPALVAEVARARKLDEDAARYYLQLLALADCSDVMIRALNDWTPGQHKKVGAKLVAAKLVQEQKQPRANRKYVLTGTWEKLFAPHPAIERWKLELYGARMESKALAAPLGRLVPLRPLRDLYAAAWARVASEDAPESKRPTVVASRDWIAEIRAAPDDDSLRQVYGDWLAEQGDPQVRIEVHAAAAACADERLRVALDKAAEGEIEEEYLESLAEQEAARAGV
jgi:uncharacterized protein (TIGR02996 family)